MTTQGCVPPTKRSVSHSLAAFPLSQTITTHAADAGPLKLKICDQMKSKLYLSSKQPGLPDCLHRHCHDQHEPSFDVRFFRSPQAQKGRAVRQRECICLLSLHQVKLAICETSSNERIYLMKETRAKANYRSQWFSYASWLIPSFGQWR